MSRRKASSKQRQSQVARSGRGNVVQVGRDYTQSSQIKLNLWISILLLAVLAVSTPFALRVVGEYFPGLEFSIPSVEHQESVSTQDSQK